MKTTVVISGGTIINGSGDQPFQGDVLVRDGKIAEIGKVTIPEGATVVDARGLVVAPGFIDIHSHSDYTLYLDPRAISSLTQGVTLEVVGNCGHGCAPYVDTQASRANVYGYHAGHEIPWRGVGQYLDALAARRPAVNVATLVPNGCLRLAAGGSMDRPSTREEIQAMKKMLTGGIEEGAFGYSTGLEYAIERDCSEQEVIDLCRVTARMGGYYATHTRNRQGEARETIAEAIRTSEGSGAALQISHISCVARLAESGRWAVEQALEQVDAARSRGIDVSFDMHTRMFGMTTLSTALPPWALDGDLSTIIRRLEDPDTCQRMKSHQSVVTALARDDWSRMIVQNSQRRPEVKGRSIADLARERGIEPFDVICEVLRDEGADFHNMLILGFVYREEDVLIAYEHPQCMVGSDATAVAPGNVCPSCMVHGAFTWAAWFWRHFVHDTKKLTPQEAVRRLTSLPAQRVGLKDRGELRPGAWADIAIFDGERFAERGTVDEPAQVASGMRHVLVNGVPTIRDGVLTGEYGGQVLRRNGRTGK